MTIYKYFFDKLFNCLLFEDEVHAILTEATGNKSFEAIRDRWGSEISDYPDVLKSLLWISISRVAIERLEKNSPKHIALKILKS